MKKCLNAPSLKGFNLAHSGKTKMSGNDAAQTGAKGCVNATDWVSQATATQSATNERAAKKVIATTEKSATHIITSETKSATTTATNEKTTTMTASEEVTAKGGEVWGRIHSYETLGALDGPALRTVVFFQGCPMRCAYCHNADALDTDGGEKKTAKEVADYVARYKNYFGADGGATLSGGEPLFQENFCYELINLLHERNIHVVLDTSGAIYSERCLERADLVILDIKRNDPTDFYNLCRFPMDATAKTLEYLKARSKRFWVRQVIVPTLNDTAEDARQLVRLAGGAERIQLLAYHTMGIDKYKKIGLVYSLQGVPPLSIEKLQELQKIVDSERNAQ